MELTLFYTLYYRFSVSEDKVWIPDSSLSGHAGSAVALYDQQSAENPLPNMQEQKTGTVSSIVLLASFV